MNYQLAPYSKRLFALLIDLIALGIITIILAKIMIAVGLTSNQAFIISLIVIPPASFLAFWVSGNSPGKRMLGLYIIDEKTGETPTTAQYAKRSILFSCFLALNIFSLITMLVNQNRKTLHDMIAGTVVVEG